MGIEQAIAIAAAALAISVIEQEEEEEQKASRPPVRTLQGTAPHQSSVTKAKSQSQGMQGNSQSSSVSIRYLEETLSSESNGDDDGTTPGGKVLVPISSMARTTSTLADDKPAAAAMKKAPSFNETPAVSSLKKTPSFVDKPVLSSGPTSSTKSGMPLKRSAEASTAKPAAPGKPGPSTAADAWEKVQLERLKGKYKQQNDHIVSWEDGKKAEARRRLDRAESEMERSRLRALERFREEMETVNQIAGGAKQKTAERMKKEEMKVKEKADALRRTSGKFPARRPCFCI